MQALILRNCVLWHAGPGAWGQQTSRVRAGVMQQGQAGAAGVPGTHMHGPGSNSAPRSATAITAIAPLRPCASHKPRAATHQRCAHANTAASVLGASRTGPKLGNQYTLVAPGTENKPRRHRHLGHEGGAIQRVHRNVAQRL